MKVYQTLWLPPGPPAPATHACILLTGWEPEKGRQLASRLPHEGREPGHGEGREPGHRDGREPGHRLASLPPPSPQNTVCVLLSRRKVPQGSKAGSPTPSGGATWGDCFPHSLWSVRAPCRVAPPDPRRDTHHGPRHRACRPHPLRCPGQRPHGLRNESQSRSRRRKAGILASRSSSRLQAQVCPTGSSQHTKAPSCSGRGARPDLPEPPPRHLALSHQQLTAKESGCPQSPQPRRNAYILMPPPQFLIEKMSLQNTTQTQDVSRLPFCVSSPQGRAAFPDLSFLLTNQITFSVR